MLDLHPSLTCRFSHGFNAPIVSSAIEDALGKLGWGGGVLATAFGFHGFPINRTLGSDGA